MNPYYIILLAAFLVMLGILVVRHVNDAVHAEFHRLAQAVDDAEFRRAEIRRVDALLQGTLPLPPDVPEFSGPVGGARRAMPPVLVVLGVILAGGAGTSAPNREWWFCGGVAALALAGVLMLATLRRRKWARIAGLLLFRANLKRLERDRAGAAEDLRELLRLTRRDDSAWAELSDDLAAQCKFSEALDAIGEAVKIDPEYDEYHMLQTSLAIRMDDLDLAEKFLNGWLGLDGVDGADPRVLVYQAALKLARGDRSGAEAVVGMLRLDCGGHALEFIAEDDALKKVRRLLPGKTP